MCSRWHIERKTYTVDHVNHVSINVLLFRLPCIDMKKSTTIMSIKLTSFALDQSVGGRFSLTMLSSAVGSKTLSLPLLSSSGLSAHYMGINILLGKK